MRALVTSFLSGIVFAAGLGISGMTRPVKVIGFLDVFGSWDLSLAFVMIGAISIFFVAIRRSRRMVSPLFAAKFAIPTRSDLDPQLMVGAALFGVGWGLGGFCPGPAIVSLASGAVPVAVFTSAMISGMLLHSSTVGAKRSDVPDKAVALGVRADA
jgi:uncharacterized protein